MTENILIEFSSDTKGITTAEAALQEFANADKAIQDQFSKTNASLKERDKVLSNLQGGLGELTSKLQNAEKAAVGAFGNKGLLQFKKDLADNTSVMKLLTASIGAANEKLKTLGKDTPEYKKLNAEIQSGIELFKNLGIEEEVAANSSQSLKSRLRELKAEIAAIDDPSSPRFIALAQEAAELEDRIGDVNAQVKLLSSDTKNLDAGIQAVQGIAGAFAAAQGALALFGAEDEEVQQTLLKVNAAMSIMQGIQQVGALLDKNSALNIFLIKSLRLQQAASTTAVAVAEGEAAVATEALAVAEGEATVATEGLNVAMSANPAGILILALGTLVGLIKIFVGDTEAAAKAQKNLNQSFEEGIKTNDGFMAALKSSREKNRAELEKNNASAASIRNNDLLSLQEQIKQTQAFENSRVKAYENADDRLRDMAAGRTKFNAKEAEELQKTVEQFTGIQKQRFDLENQLEIAQINNEKENFKERLTNHTAFVEASVLKTQEGSRAELVAQISAIRAKEQEDLKSEAHLPGEIAKIRAAADRDAQKVKQQIRLFDLNQEKFLVDARLQKVKEGGVDELNARLDVLKIEETIEITSAQNNKTKILDIEAKFNKQRIDLSRAYNKQVAEDAANTRISGLSSQVSNLTVAGADATNEQLLILKKKLIDEQAALEVIGINYSEHNEELRQAKVKAVYDKQLADKAELEKQKRALENSQDESYFNAATQLQLDAAKRVLDSTTSSYEQRKKATQAYYKYEFELIQNAEDADKNRLENGEINQKEFDTKHLERLRQQKALEFKVVQDAEAKKQEVIQRSFELGNMLLSGYFDALKTSYESDLQNVQDLEGKKLITSQEADKRRRAIKRAEAAADKESALFQIAITTAQNIIKDHLDPLLIGLDLGALALQTAFVLSKPLPKFRKGGFTGKQGLDEEAGIVHGQEFVAHAEATKRYKPALEAMNNLQFDKYLASLTPSNFRMSEMKMPSFEIPTMNALPEGALSKINNSAPIDYKLLAHEVGIEVAKKVGKVTDIAGVDVRIDKDGIVIIAKEGIDRTEFVNRKYSFSTKK